MTIPKTLPAWAFAALGVAGGWLLYQATHSGTPDRPEWTATAGQQTAAVTAAPAQPTAPPVTVIVVTTNGTAPANQPTAPQAPRPASQRSAPASPQPVAGGGQVIVARDGSIVLVGDNARLTANTGATSSSGAVVLDSQSSTLTSGASTVTGGTPGGSSGPGNHPVDQFGGRPVAIAGYEDHSVNVVGNDTIATYDDSNVFINRDGPINANTGDTDSSGLNAVDITDSVVGSGASTDGGDDAEDEDADEADSDEGPDSSGGTGAPLAATTVGPAGSARPADTASSVDPDAATTATGRDPLVIGADGFDDLSIRTAGTGNIVTYDDSNLVVGGTGPVNAQIGDSDTGGAVLMGIHGSQAIAGASS